MTGDILNVEVVDDIIAFVVDDKSLDKLKEITGRRDMGIKSRGNYALGGSLSNEEWDRMFPFIYFYRREGEWCIKKNGTDVSKEYIKVLFDDKEIKLYKSEAAWETYTNFKVDTDDNKEVHTSSTGPR